MEEESFFTNWMNHRESLFIFINYSFNYNWRVQRQKYDSRTRSKPTLQKSKQHSKMLKLSLKRCPDNCLQGKLHPPPSPHLGLGLELGLWGEFSSGELNLKPFKDAWRTLIDVNLMHLLQEVKKFMALLKLFLGLTQHMLFLWVPFQALFSDTYLEPSLTSTMELCWE